MLTLRLDVNEGVQIGAEPGAGAAIKVVEKSGRRVTLAILTDLQVTRTYFGLAAPSFIRGLAPARAEPHAISCATA